MRIGESLKCGTGARDATMQRQRLEATQAMRIEQGIDGGAQAGASQIVELASAGVSLAVSIGIEPRSKRIGPPPCIPISPCIEVGCACANAAGAMPSAALEASKKLARCFRLHPHM